MARLYGTAMCPATPVTCGADTASDENGELGGEVLQSWLSALPDVLRIGAVWHIHALLMPL
jgi:hypothetical protein